MDTAIEFKHVKKVYGEKVIIDDFNLKITPGEFLTVVGSSGCGKTTILKMINGLIIPDEGQVLVHDQCTQAVDLIELRRGIGYAIQGSVLFPHMDEPFGAVDEITRSTLQDEILRIHHQENITIIFVTHDINEALKLGSRVMVMDQGKVVQLASPREILEHPKTEFVRRLVQRKDDFLQ